MYSPSFSFFLYPFFLSLFTKQWHVAGLTVALHPFPPNQMHRNLTQSTLGTSWHVISSSFSFPRFLFPSTSFLSLSFSTPVPFPPPPYSLQHPFSEPLGIDDRGHMTKGAAPGHVCVSTALPDTMTRTHVTWLRMLTKTTPDISV